MKQNVNHKNYFKTEAEAEVVEPAVVIEEPVVEELEPVTEHTRESLMALNKKEQITLLKTFGFSNTRMKSFRTEEDRVDALLLAFARGD